MDDAATVASARFHAGRRAAVAAVAIGRGAGAGNALSEMHGSRVRHGANGAAGPGARPRLGLPRAADRIDATPLRPRRVAPRPAPRAHARGLLRAPAAAMASVGSLGDSLAGDEPASPHGPVSRSASMVSVPSSRVGGYWE